MVTGLIVSGALFAILEVSLHQSSRLSDVAQATQLGRTAMNRVVDAMHSGCIAEKFAPVQAGSSPTKLILVSGYSEETEVPTKATTATGVHKDEFEFANKRLVDKTALSSAEVSAGSYTWEAAKEFRLSENVKKTKVGKVEEPIFTYWAYATAASTSTSAASSTLTKIEKFEGEKETLTAAQAKKVASVEVKFNQLPTDNEEKQSGRSVDLNSQVTFSFSAPDSEATIVAGPCE
jgi:hypothetical protein